MPVRQLHYMVCASLMAALTAVGAYIHIPLGPVPIVLQNLIVFLTGLLLGSRWGMISVGVYLLVGAIGIPVFAGAKGGIAHFMGPTGGYLLAYLPAVYLIGTVSEQARGRLAGDILAVTLGATVIYAAGVPWLKFVTGMPWVKAVTVGMLPFLPGDAVKAAAAVVLVKTLRPILARQLKPAPFSS